MEVTEEYLNRLFSIVEDGEDNDAFIAADKLGEIGGEEVINKLVGFLSSSKYNTVYLAARALSKAKDNQPALEPIFELIKTGKEPFLKGILAEALSGFNCSDYFVEIFKLYLFGNFKVSALAKDLLDEQEFDVTPRVLRKAEKHWKHFEHNVKHDAEYDLKKKEVEDIFSEIRSLFTEEQQEEDNLEPNDAQE